MSDYNSSLPTRTENNGDIAAKIVDGTITSQALSVDAAGKVAAKLSDGSGNEITSQTNGAQRALDVGINVAGVQIDPRDIRDLAFATDTVDVSGSDVTVSNTVTVQSTDLDIRDLVFATDSVDVTGSDVTVSNTVTVQSTDLDIRDLTHVSDSVKVGDGTDFLAVNTDGSINVVMQEDVGTEVVDYNTSASLAAAASSNHDWTSAAASKLYQVWASASGKLKIQVQIETAAASGVFNTIAVGFNSTANPNINLNLSKYAAVPNGSRVRVIRTNLDNQAQDVYSTIVAIQG